MCFRMQHALPHAAHCRLHTQQYIFLGFRATLTPNPNPYCAPCTGLDQVLKTLHQANALQAPGTW